MKTVEDMHERKSVMAKHADAFIALPGIYIRYIISMLFLPIILDI